MHLVDMTHSEECTFFLSVCPETGLLQVSSQRGSVVVPWVSNRTGREVESFIES